jgi:hypothetical protein
VFERDVFNFFCGCCPFECACANVSFGPIHVYVPFDRRISDTFRGTLWIIPR